MMKTNDAHLPPPRQRTRATPLDFATEALAFVNDARASGGRALGPVVWFVAGAAAVGSLVLLAAPTTGSSLRHWLARLLDGG
jgi:hypothetical protein